MHTLIPHHENNQHNTPAPRDRRTVQPSSQKKENTTTIVVTVVSPGTTNTLPQPRTKTHHYLQDTLFTQPRTRNAPPRQPKFLTYTKEHKIRKNTTLQKKKKHAIFPRTKKKKPHKYNATIFSQTFTTIFFFIFSFQLFLNYSPTQSSPSPPPSPHSTNSQPTPTIHVNIFTQLSTPNRQRSPPHFNVDRHCNQTQRAGTPFQTHRPSTPPATTAPAAAKQACQRQ